MSVLSEQILNGTSAQLGYTVPFTLVHAGKYRTEDKSKIHTTEKLNTTQNSKKTQNTANQNYLGLVASYDTPPRNEVGLFYNSYNVPKPTWNALLVAHHRLKPPSHYVGGRSLTSVRNANVTQTSESPQCSN